ncbi:hypothetical protein MYX76_18090 [Desulfobacterota bacterium AH_259_B03_O07]|nr:hypothetical protein [Desulfobacterota bacterium AH_259_B03_O07]
MRYLKVLVITLFWVPVLFVPRLDQAQGQPPETVGSLLARVEALEAKLANVSVVDGTINGLMGPHFILEGVNVHIRSGSGCTDDGTFIPCPPSEVLSTEPLLGLGNLVVGYNEDNVFLIRTIPDVNDRTGSHNLIIGAEHSYSSFSGFVAGFDNTISDDAASVSGGAFNTASGIISSVSGGGSNTASGGASSVSGGNLNTASGDGSSVSGGTNNTAIAQNSSVSGGSGNTAGSIVLGSIIGVSSSVSGGSNVTAPDDNDWAAGTLVQDFDL